MARSLLVFVIVFVSHLASASTDIVGTWVFSKIKPDQGQEQGENRPLMPAPDTDLVITFEFDAGGMNRLHWARKNEQAFCERRGQYRFSGETLQDIVVWTHPENDIKCQQDPEMKLGTMTASPAQIVDGKLELGLGVGDQIVTYIWERQAP